MTPCWRTRRPVGTAPGARGMIGAWLGAHLGTDAVPASWRERLTAHAAIAATVDRLLAAGANPAR